MFLLLLAACTATDVAPAWSIDVSLSATEVELGDEVTATVTVTDEDGERVNEPWTLSTVPSEGVEVDGDALTFVGDGVYTVVATMDAWTELTGEAGPVTADSNGPVIVVSSPSRGEHFEDQTEITVAGYVEDPGTGVDTLTLNGEALDISSEGEFSTTMAVAEGLNVVTLEATDIDGNVTDTLVGVLNGDYADASEAVDPAMDIFLTAEGLDSLTSVALAELDADTLEADLIADNPVVSDTVAVCVDYEVDLLSLSYGEIEASIAPEAFGLRVDLVIPDLETQADTTIDFCSLSTSQDVITATDTLTTVSALLSLSVPTPGDVEVEVRELDITFTNLEVDYGTLLDSIEGLGLSLEDLGLDAETLASLVLETIMEDEIPPILEEALESIAVSEEVEVLDATATLDALISDVWTSAEGLNVYLQVVASVDGEADVPEAPGSLHLGGQAAPDGSSQLAASISVDALNRVLFSAWEGGVLHLSVTQEETGLDAETLGLLFEGAETMDLELEPLLAPVVVPATGDGFFDLQMGELHIHASGLMNGEETEFATWSAMATGDISVEIDEETGELAILIGGLDVEVDELVEDPNVGTEAEFRELLLGGVAASQLGSLLPDLTFALPEIEGYELTLTGVEVTGDAGTWMTASGSLSAAE